MPRAAASTLSVLLVVLAFGNAIAGERRVVGQTYPIAEPDLLQEIQQRAASTDWKAITQRQDPSSFTAFQTASLPPATQDASFVFDPTYTLPHEVRDPQGGVIYPAGTTINVYARRQFPGRTIVIGADAASFAWLDAVAKPAAADKVLIAGTNMVEARRLAGPRRIYALEPRAIERFGLRAIPSIVQQEGTQLRVREFALTAKEQVRR